MQRAQRQQRQQAQQEVDEVHVDTHPCSLREATLRHPAMSVAGRLSPAAVAP
jgi:hypothetical protein